MFVGGLTRCAEAPAYNVLFIVLGPGPPASGFTSPSSSPDWHIPATSQQVGAQTETELREKKLRVEDALNATKAAVQEGIVIGGGCTLLKLAAKVDMIRDTLPNDEQKLGADIIRKVDVETEQVCAF